MSNSTIETKQLIWVDLEMTGVDPNNHVIIEIATIVTNLQLEEIACGPVFAIAQTQAELDKMDEWNQNTHGESGLIKRVQSSTVNTYQAEQQTLAFLQQYVQPNTSPICGNTIAQDRHFLLNHMPQLYNFFHYRCLDVSSFKMAALWWSKKPQPQVEKASSHTALADIRESIAEMKQYKDMLFC